MTQELRAFLFDDHGPMSKTDLDILRSALGDGTTPQESGVAHMKVAMWKAGRAFRAASDAVFAEMLAGVERQLSARRRAKESEG